MTNEALNEKEQAILDRSKMLGKIAMPGFALAKVLTPSTSGDAELGVGFILTFLLWPVTIPSAVVFFSIQNAHDKHFNVEAIMQRKNKNEDSED